MRKLKSNCHYCGYLCGFIASVDDEGRLVDLEPDPSRFPYDSSIVKGCRRWRINLDVIDGEDRINYPLKRVGERGSGSWERISWDQALDEIAEKMSDLVERYGPATVASTIGGPHACFWPLHRFLNLLGSPNNMGIGQICWNPRIWIDCLTFGWPIEADINPKVSKAVFLWATNPAVSDNSLFWRTLQEVADSDVPLVVVDPRLTKTAKAADLHLAPFPGTDCVLALGLIHQIIQTDRYNHDFVEKWCHGFEGLVEHVQAYTAYYVEAVTGVPADDLQRAAEIFSQPGPTALLSGRGIDQLGANTAPTHRALAILRAITGDIDRAGACVINMMSDFVPEVDMETSYTMPQEVRDAQLNTPVTPLQCYDGYDGAIDLTLKLGRRLPMRYLTSAHPNLVWRAMLTDEPYPIRALIVQAANPLITYANSHLVHDAMCRLDLMVVLEYYMTPTAQMADYVLPSAGAFERPLFQAQGGIANVAYGGWAAVEPYYERKCDYYFFRELGLRMGQADYWPQENLEDALEFMMSTTSLGWEGFRDVGLYYGKTWYSKHDLDLPDGGKWGFATSTGKVELKNEYLISLGATLYPEPVPIDDDLDRQFASSFGLDVDPFTNEVVGAAGSALGAATSTRDAAAGSAPDTTASTSALDAASNTSNPRIMRMITGARMQPFWASSFFNNKKFRKSHPYPTASMSRATMEAAGIKVGDWVEVKTSVGSAQFVAVSSELVDGVISVEYGWWYPEDKAAEPDLGGMWKSNVNVLTSGDIETSEPLIGSWKYNGILCYVTVVGHVQDSQDERNDLDGD